MTDLLNCPFCGGEASIGHVAFSRPLAHIEWEDGTPVTEAFYGHCKNCNASTRNGFHGGQRNEAEAIAAWNARTSDAEITRLTEALRDAEEREKALADVVETLYRPLQEAADAMEASGRQLADGVTETIAAARQALAGAKP